MRKRFKYALFTAHPAVGPSLSVLLIHLIAQHEVPDSDVIASSILLHPFGIGGGDRLTSFGQESLTFSVSGRRKSKERRQKPVFRDFGRISNGEAE